MKKIENFNNSLEKEDTIAVKKFLHRLYRNSFWFIFSMLLCMGAAFLLTKYMAPVYESKTLLLINHESNMDVLGEGGALGQVLNKDINIQNQIGVLSSMSLNKQVLNNLDWKTAWFSKDIFRDHDLYGKEPFFVTMTPEAFNLYNVPVYVSMVDSLNYRVTIEETFTYRGIKKTLNISEIKKFGEPFINKFFNFTIWKKDPKITGTYYFKFTDPRWQAILYTSKIKVNPEERNSDLLNVTLKDSDPQRAEDYLNELSKVFIQFGLIEKNKKSSSTVKFIDSQLSGVIDTLRETGRNFSSFRSQNQIINIGQEGDLIVQNLGQLQTERQNEQTRLDYYENLHKYLNDKEKMKEVIVPSVVGITDASLTGLVSKLSDLYSQREIISYSVKDKNPSYVLIQNEINLTTQKLKENLASLINNSKIILSNLDRRIESMNSQLQAYPKTEQELMNIKRSFDLNNDLYTFLLKKRAEAAITHASNTPDAQVLDQADEDTTIKIGPKPVFNMAAGAVAGFIIPLIIMMIASYFNDCIHSAEEIEQMTDLQVVGNIVTNKQKKELTPAIKYPRSALAESFRELRTNLRFLDNQDKSKVVSINSVIPKEGKSFLSVNLASMIAINSMKVLIIDCDLRKPSLHKYFGCNNKIGLSTYLIGQNNMEEIIQATQIENLSLISAGSTPPNPSEILETGTLEELIKNSRSHFDYIIIDNPPLSLVSDGIIISQFTDVNMFVLRQDYSTKGEVRFINHMHINKSMKNAGIILNDIHIRKHSQVGYYGAKYSYRHSYGYEYYLETV